MEELEKHKLFQDLIDTWGEEAQLRICVEEMSELTKEICKYLRYKYFESEEKVDEARKNIIEETADVLNCVEQIKVMFGEKEVDKEIDFKLNRVAKRLEEYKKKN